MKMCVNSVGTTSVGTVQSRRELDESVRFRGREGEVEPGLGDREEQAGEDGPESGSEAELAWLLALGPNGQHARLPVLLEGWASSGLPCHFS